MTMHHWDTRCFEDFQNGTMGLTFNEFFAYGLSLDRGRQVVPSGFSVAGRAFAEAKRETGVLIGVVEKAACPDWPDRELLHLFGSRTHGNRERAK